MVNAERAQVLRDAGFGTLQRVATADLDDLAAVEGVDGTQAEVMQSYAESMTSEVVADGGSTWDS